MLKFKQFQHETGSTTAEERERCGIESQVNEWLSCNKKINVLHMTESNTSYCFDGGESDSRSLSIIYYDLND